MWTLGSLSKFFSLDTIFSTFGTKLWKTFSNILLLLPFIAGSCPAWPARQQHIFHLTGNSGWDWNLRAITSPDSNQNSKLVAGHGLHRLIMKWWTNLSPFHSKCKCLNLWKIQLHGTDRGLTRLAMAFASISVIHLSPQPTSSLPNCTLYAFPDNMNLPDS